MKPEPSEELLSAYLDGAVTPEEKSAVETWLETSPAARRTLNEFGRLSTTLRDLPRYEVPPEFAAQVLKTVERTMLLPAHTMPATGGRSAHSRWLTLGVPCGAVAALLAFALVLGPRLNLPQNAELADSQQSTAIEREGLTRPERSTPAPAIAAKPTADFSASAGGAAPADPSSSSSPPAGRAEGKAAPAALTPGDSASNFRFDQKLTSADVGTFKEVIKRNASGQVATLKVIVLDRQQGYLAVQEALKSQDIVAGASPSTGQVRESGNSPPAQAATGEMAILVQATEQQLVAAFQALIEQHKQQDPVFEMQIGQPYELAAIDDDVREMIVAFDSRRSPDEIAGVAGKTADQAGAANRSRSAAADATAKKQQPATVTAPPRAGEKGESTGPDVADKAVAKKSATDPAKSEGEGDEANVARQISVPWPPTAGRRGRSRQGVAAAPAPPAENVGDRALGGTLPGRRGAKLPEPAARQVFIVIQQADPTTKKTAAPPAASRPDGAS